MTAELEGSLNQIASLSRTLNEASDQLSKQLSEIEAALNAFAAGIWVWAKRPIKKEYETDPAIAYVHELGYGKLNGKWGLLVSSGWEDAEPEGIETKFLRDAPRDIRLRAMDEMPQLLEAFAQKLAETTEETTKKVLRAKEIAVALSKKQRR